MLNRERHPTHAAGHFDFGVARDEHTVVIEDDGPGLPAAERTMIFEHFRRGPTAAGSGAGLGLAIARRVMERGGGQLLLDSSATRGARFLVVF
jgi:two-component system, OmpR family, sensor histidine kinase TctE